METKNCKDCKLDLDVSNFSKISMICQKCKDVRKYQSNKKYQEEHKDKVAENKHKYFINNREKINEKKKIHWEKVDAERISKRILREQAKLDELIEYEEVAVVDDQNNIITVLDV